MLHHRKHKQHLCGRCTPPPPAFGRRALRRVPVAFGRRPANARRRAAHREHQWARHHTRACWPIPGIYFRFLYAHIVFWNRSRSGWFLFQ